MRRIVAAAALAGLAVPGIAGGQAPVPAPTPPDPSGLIGLAPGEAATLVAGGTAAAQAAVSGDVQGAVDRAVAAGGNVAFQLPFALVGELTGAFPGAPAVPSPPAAPGPPAVPGVPTGPPATEPPSALATPLSRLRPAARLGRIVVRVSLDRPGRTAVGGVLRARGMAPVRFPTAVLEYANGGDARVAFRLPTRARRPLGRATQARLTLGFVSSDAAGNARRQRETLTLYR